MHLSIPQGDPTLSPQTTHVASEIHQALLQHNKMHFQQTNYTPFGPHGPGAPWVNPDSDLYAGEAILNGEFQG